MRYAVISDIHGNYPALKAILEDIRKNSVDSIIFTGDYCLSGPQPDECIAALRDTDNKYIIRGNEEKYLENLIGKDRSTWNDGQMQISYWCFKNIKRDNLNYLISLPESADIECGGIKIRAAHSSVPFIGGCEFRLFGPAVLAKRYKHAAVTRETLDRDIYEALHGDPEFNKAVSELAEGVYLFGHSHVQWTYKAENRGVYLINPGSCGLPLDGIADGIPYSVLDISPDGSIGTEQRRIPFDKKRYIEALKDSRQYAEANVWSKVIIKELSTAKEHMTFFLEFAESYANGIHDDRRPYVVETWEKAYEIWASEMQER